MSTESTSARRKQSVRDRFVARLKIAGRIAFFMISSGYRPPPPKVATQPVDKLFRTAEHPRIEIQYGDCLLLELLPGKIDERSLPGPPRTEDADCDAFARIE